MREPLRRPLEIADRREPTPAEIRRHHTPSRSRTLRIRWPLALAAIVSFATWGASSAAAAIVNGPSARDPYEMVTMGDSYAAREGAPDQAGQYNGNGPADRHRGDRKAT